MELYFLQSLMWSDLATHSVCNKAWKLRSLHIKQSDKVTSVLFNLISLYIGIKCRSNFNFQLLIINKILSLHNNSKISRSRREKMHVNILNLSSFSVNCIIPTHWVQGVPSYCIWQWLEKVVTGRSTNEGSNTCVKVTQREKKIAWKFLEDCEVTHLSYVKISCQRYYCKMKCKIFNPESTVCLCTVHTKDL